jgi:hypothetical protein
MRAVRADRVHDVGGQDVDDGVHVQEGGGRGGGGGFSSPMDIFNMMFGGGAPGMYPTNFKM